MKAAWLVAALWLVGGSQAQNNGWLLRQKVTPGDEHHYKLNITVTTLGPPGAYMMEATSIERVASVQGDRQHLSMHFSVDRSTGSGVLKCSAEMIAGVGKLGYEVIRDTRGTIHSLSVQGTNSTTVASGLNLIYPTERVKVGSSWDSTFTLLDRPVTIRFTLSRALDQGGRKVLLIEGRYPSGQNITALEPTRFWVDAGAGRVLKMTGHTEYMLGTGKGMRARFVGELVATTQTELIQSRRG